NNAYCQDSPISWVSWDTRDEWMDLYAMTREILRLRADHPVLRPERYQYHTEVLDEHGKGLGRVELTWFNEVGNEMDPGNWHDPGRRTLGRYTSDAHQAFLTYLHAHADGTTVTLPGGHWATDYRVVVHSGFDGEFPSADEVLPAGSTLHLPGRSVALLQATVPTPEPPPAKKRKKKAKTAKREETATIEGAAGEQPSAEPTPEPQEPPAADAPDPVDSGDSGDAVHASADTGAELDVEAVSDRVPGNEPDEIEG
ncbi:MAG: hypothetical protein Q4F67_17475, partial [Propionibacteriaceae bacterium]|nr:hypothetical protein [Propionibacteriaceae bacterium]